MATALLPTGGIALVGAPDSDIESKNTTCMTLQAMQVEITQDVVDELIESIRGGHSPQLLFGKAPQLKYGDKSHVLQSNLESHRFELYRSSRPGDTCDGNLEFVGLINHSLIVQEAEDVTAGVDSALEQLRSNMAAISEIKEANKTIVGEATPIRTPSYGGHRRFPSTGFKAQHLAPSKLGSPLLSAPSSPMHKRPPTSQPSSSRDTVLNALRMPVIHLLAREPATEAWLADTCRTSLGNVRELLPKIAKRITPEGDRWQLTDKAFRDIDPYKFPYPTSEDREQAIDAAIRAFDRQRLAKDDRLWQVLLPRSERGQGICLSRSKVKPPEAKASTPIHKISDLTKKKPTGKKADERAGGKKAKVVREVEAVKVKSVVKEKESRPVTKREVITTKASAPAPRLPVPAPVPPSRSTPPIEPSKVRPKKGPAGSNTQDNSSGNSNNKSNINNNSSSDGKPKMSARPRPARPAMPVNTKPKNPSPLSASPPLNASDFEDNHPVHKALAAAPSPASNRAPKRKAKDVESLAIKKPHHSPASVKRKSDESSSSNTPTAPAKVRKVAHIDTGLASRYHHNNPQASPGASSTSTTSPSVPSLSFRQTVELSQRFQKYYKKYEELYWQLTESEKPPSKAQRDDLWKMHKKLEEMKKEIKAGAIVQH